MSAAAIRECISVFITASSRDEAENIAVTVVEEGLAACATLMPQVQSIYRWQGKIERAEECALILKTTAEKFSALEARVKQLHSYECPCIVAWPIVAGNKAYVDWIKGN